MTTPSNKRYARYEMAWSGARTAKGGVCVGSSLCFVPNDMGEYQAVLVGDHIVSTPVLRMELFIDEDERPEGFLVPGIAHDHSARV